MKLFRNLLILFVSFSIGLAPMGASFAHAAEGASAMTVHQHSLHNVSAGQQHNHGQASHAMHSEHDHLGMVGGLQDSSSHDNNCCKSGKFCSAFCFAKCFQLLGFVVDETQNLGAPVLRVLTTEQIAPATRSIRPSPPPPRA